MVLSPEGVLIAGRLSGIHQAGGEVQPWSEGQTFFKTHGSTQSRLRRLERMGCLVFGCFWVASYVLYI